MKQWKKIVCGLIFVWTGILASLIISNNASAQTEVTEDFLVTEDGLYYYSINEDGNTVTIIDYNREIGGGDMTIPSVIDGKTVTCIGDGAFAESGGEWEDSTSPSHKYFLHAREVEEYDYSPLKSITIPDSVTSIGNRVFFSCNHLTSITIPDSATSIGDGAFSYCDHLTSITVPNSVTSIGDYAFSYCDKLINITISDSITSIGRSAFSGCDKLINITIPDKVTSIGGYVFQGCKSLTSINIPDSVTSIGDMAFSYCDRLTSITISGNNVSIGDEAFYYCKKLTDITLDGVTSIGYRAFNGCAITHINIPDSVTSIDYAFYECVSLTSITISDGVTSIGNSAFQGCANLTSINIPDSVTSIGDMAFSYCDRLTSITISGNNVSIGRSAFGDCDCLTSITISGNNVSIGDSAFGDCDRLTYIAIPGSVTSIGNEAFYYCKNLTGISIPDSVTSIGDKAFSYCENLRTIIFPDNITALGYDLFQKSGYCNEIYHTIDVYYTGSKSNWETISNPFFDFDADVTMHFNSTFPKQISLDTSAIKLSIGGTKKLSASITPANVTANRIIWHIHNNNTNIHFTGNSASQQDLAEGEEIEITADYIGTTTITAQTANGLTASVEVTVTEQQGSQCDIQGHTEEIIPAINATCTDDGYTEGIYCSICGEILLPQEVIPALGHTWSEWATIGNISGITIEETRHCTICGQTETRTKQNTNPSFPSNPPQFPTPMPTTSPNPSPTTRPAPTTIPKFSPTTRPDIVTPTSIKKVTKLTVKNKKKKTATLSWKKVAGADGYEIQYAKNKKFRFVERKKTRNTKVSIKKLKKGTTYYFQIRAYKKQGQKTIYGKWSNGKKIKIRK